MTPWHNGAASRYVCASLNRDANAYVLGVFDGHGAEGDLCAQFAARKLVYCLEREITTLLKKQKLSGRVVELYDPTADAPRLEELFERAFKNSNLLMHAASFDTQLSGTTAVCCLVVGTTLIVGNVGDSRAILGYVPEEQGQIAVQALSVDQTPYRRDERERVKQYGARIMTVDQVEGREKLHENWGTRLGDEIDETGDPPRVWNDTLERPGCAFTRSLGDMIAERLGVVADPEIHTHTLRREDKFVVVASDGVFEFITSQAVADMVDRVRTAGGGPLEACRRVVAESYRLWLQYEVRSDDITMVCAFFDDFGGVDVAADGFAPNARAGEPSAQLRATKAKLRALDGGGEATRARAASREDFREVRPVRRVLAKEKRVHLNMSESQKLDPGEVAEFRRKLDTYRKPKTKEEESKIETMTRSNYLFLNLSADKLAMMISVMQKELFSAGDVIMRAGDEGDKFYLVDTGEYDVIIRDSSQEPQVVHTYRHAGESFGELSLMYGKPRAATIKCVREGVVWTLERLAFRAILMKDKSNSSLIATLSKVEGFKQLSVPQLQRVTDACATETFEPGAYIIKQGDVGDTFYVISEGECVCTKTPQEGGDELELVRLGANAWFGELALLKDEPRAANVKASEKGPVKVVVVSRRIFKEISAEVVTHLDEEHERRVDASEALKSEDGKHFSQFLAQKGGAIEQRVHALDAKRLEMAYAGCPLKTSLAGFFGAYDLALQPTGSRKVSAKWHAIADCAKDGGHKRILNERAVLTSLRDASSLLPHVLATQVDGTFATLVIAENVVGDVHSLLESDFDAGALAFYGACLAEALEYVHGAKILARNVTSEAVLLRADGYPILGDLSLAKRLSPKDDRAYTMCGDVLYFAPEVIAGAGYAYPADFWALGVLLYEMYSGVFPFGTPGQSESVVYAAVSKMEYAVPDGAPPPVAEVFAKLFKREYPRSKAPDLRKLALFADLDAAAVRERRHPAPHAAVCEERRAALAESGGAGDDEADFKRRAAPAEAADVWHFRSY